MARVYLLLVAALFLSAASAALVCGPNDCVPGIENLGMGFDVVTGQMKKASVVDLKESAPAGTWTNPYKGTQYGIPGATRMSMAPAYDVDSVTFRSSVAYANSRYLDLIPFN